MTFIPNIREKYSSLSKASERIKPPRPLTLLLLLLLLLLSSSSSSNSSLLSFSREIFPYPGI
jgi:hypothetical protein